jgi:hypothetical protein
MAFGKLTSLSIERAHRFGGPLLLSDGDGLSPWTRAVN